MGNFELYKDKANEYRFRLKASNDQIILVGEGYKSKNACENGIESVKVNAINDDRYERLMSKSNQPYFNLKASNGHVIGTSETYSSVSAMENGIKSVKHNAPTAAIVDLS